jgi:serine/threonine protein kinase
VGAVSAHQRAPVGTLAAGAKLDRYEILARLAAGGMATVYVARVQAVAGFERLVAIKVLHQNLAHEDEFIRMFLDEARLAASIRHPNVVSTIDISDSKEAGCGYFIVMEYIEGDHLGALLAGAHKSDERLALPVALRIVADALGGLGAAHALCDDTGKSLQLVHRDVSPHNILVGRDGVVRLTDFGVAKAEDRLTHTRDGQVKGKLAYMAPEQASSGATDARSDLFSMGVILWECVTGQRLFRAETTAATLHKLMHAPIALPSSIDPALAPLDPLLAKALAREPAERFQNAEELVRAIEEIAPAVGGLASLRGVARAVKQHAAAKLKRDKKLVDDAMRALRPEDEALEPEALTDEVTGQTAPSATDISLTGGSLSASKVSGVFSHDTLPGMRRIFARSGAESSATQPSDVAAASDGLGSATAQPLRRVFAPIDLGVVRTKRAWAIGAAVLLTCAIIYAALSPNTKPPQAAPSMRVSNADLAVGPGFPSGSASSVVSPSTTFSGSVTAASPVEPPGPTRAVRSAGRRDDAPARNVRRARKDSARRERGSTSAPPVRSDVMPNPYHDH